MAPKKDKGIPAALLIPGEAHKEPDGDEGETDLEGADDFDAAAGDEVVRAVHSKDGAAAHDAIHSIVTDLLHKHGLIKDEGEAEAPKGDEEMSLGEEPAN